MVLNPIPIVIILSNIDWGGEGGGVIPPSHDFCPYGSVIHNPIPTYEGLFFKIKLNLIL